MKRTLKRTRSTGLLLCFTMIVGLSANSLWGEESRTEENKLGQKFFVRLGKDFAAVVSSPKDWGRSEFLGLAAVSGAGLVLYAYDHDICEWAKGHQSDPSNDAFSVISRAGEGGVLLGLISVLYGTGALAAKDGLRKTALLSLESLAVTTFYTWSIKCLAGRARPSTGQSSHSFEPFSLANSHWSLPSGHAASAFAVATTVASQSDEAAVDILAYSLAGLVGVSRIYQNKHWASDVFIGSAIGYFVAKKICSLNRRSQRKPLSVGFICTTHHQSLTLSWEF